MIQKNAVKVCTLENALDYKSDAVVYKLMEKYKVTKDESEELFENLKKWLWLINQTHIMKQEKKLDSSFSLSIDVSMVMLDEMWHTFILFTRDYIKYCDDKFGYYIHHSPASKETKDRLKAKLKESRQEVIQEGLDKAKIQYEIIYDLLGKETLMSWYEIYAEKYTPKKMAELKKPIESVLGLT